MTTERTKSTKRKSIPYCETVKLDITKRSSSNECIEFEFKICDFSSVRNERIESPELIASHECKSSWKIVLDPSPSSRNFYFYPPDASKMAVILKRTDSGQCDVKASLFFKITNMCGRVFVKDSIFMSNFSNRNRTEFYSDILQKPTSCSCDMRMHYHICSDQILIIKGTLSIQDCCPIKKDEKISALQRHFKDSYQNNSFSDVVISFGDDNMYAHKMVLTARSPVFQKMFEQNMKETNLSIIEITDIEKSAFDIFLIFLYTGELENKEIDIVKSLYSIADKYEVKTLFKTCRDILESYISNETAPVILKLADMHGDETLKEKALQFICENFTKIEGTVPWNNLLDTDPRLASYTLKVVSSSVSAAVKT